ncbi:MAG TPA: hypothetical protein P5048_04930, partial [Chlamydiales bacterium]|nr:hypothetical protein [Chlamydiales bacterium]
ITLNETAGATTRLGDVVVNSVDEITIHTVYASSINLIASSGIATINGSLNTNGAGNSIVLVGNNFVRNGEIITTNGGSVVITNSGVISGSLSNDTLISGSYTQNGTGPGGLIGVLIVGQDISLSSPTILGGDTTLTAGGNIQFSSTLDAYNGGLAGNYDLILSAGGNIVFAGIVGGSNPLDSVQIQTAVNVTATDIYAGSVSQSTGSGTSLFNGAVNVLGTGGISLTGNNITKNAAWQASSGSIVVNQSGTFLVGGSGNILTGGSFRQTGTGPVSIARGIIADEAISFAGPVTMSSSLEFLASGSESGVTFSNTLNGSYLLNMNCPNGGAISFSGTIGGTSPLTQILIENAGNVTLPVNLYADIFELQASSGIATLNNMYGDGSRMSEVSITANQILFGGIIETTDALFVSSTSILNVSDPVEINTVNDVTFNALDGDVGSLTSPIYVNTLGTITAGSTYLADFNGTAVDDTVHRLETNGPDVVIFNGVVIYGALPSDTTTISARYLVAPGFDSSFFNLASDFFFKTFFFGAGSNYIYPKENPWFYVMQQGKNEEESAFLIHQNDLNETLAQMQPSLLMKRLYHCPQERVDYLSLMPPSFVKEEKVEAVQSEEKSENHLSQNIKPLVLKSLPMMHEKSISFVVIPVQADREYTEQEMLVMIKKQIEKKLQEEQEENLDQKGPSLQKVLLYYPLKDFANLLMERMQESKKSDFDELLLFSEHFGPKDDQSRDTIVFEKISKIDVERLFDTVFDFQLKLMKEHHPEYFNDRDITAKRFEMKEKFLKGLGFLPLDSPDKEVEIISKSSYDAYFHIKDLSK